MFEMYLQNFNYLTKIQKSSFISYIRIFVKKNQTLSEQDIYYKFLDEMAYDSSIGNVRFSWINDFLEEENFIKDLKTLIKNNLLKIKYKNSQKDYIEKQKVYLKIAGKKATEWRQSHEKPTARQISYYNSLCKKKGIENINLSDKSKFDLKIMIANLLENSNTDD